MKNKPIFDIKKDLWVVLFDIIAVNISYFMAIVLRYYVRSSFDSDATSFLKIFWKFAPIYTVLSIIIFLLFRLYNGMWRYAGLRDINRVVVASVVSSVIYVIGTMIIFKKMPASYYLVGAFIQLCLIVFIRYIYRIIDIEKQKAAAKNLPVQNMMIIGTGSTATKVLTYLNNEVLYKPVVMVDENCKEKSISGIPVAASAQDAIEKYNVKSVLVADPLLSNAKREELSVLCSSKQIELYDYTGFMKSASGAVSLLDLSRVISGKASITCGDKTFASAEEAMHALKGGYSVASVSGDNLKIEVKPNGEAAVNEEWIEEYKQETGEDVSFF